MRIFEATLLANISLLLVTRWIWPLKWRAELSVCSLIVMAFHFCMEGYRWQMIPIYALTIELGLHTIFQGFFAQTKPVLGKVKKSVTTITNILLFLLFAAPPILLPIPSTPEPTGPDKIGTLSFLLEDTTREEIFSGTPGGSRRFMVQIWYPALPGEGVNPGPWMENTEALAPAIASYLGLPSFFLDHIKYANSHSYSEAPIKDIDEKYPVLLFSHGWDGFRSQNSYQVENLASHGFIVIAPDHSYGAVATVLPDGEIITNNPTALPSRMDLPEDQFIPAANRLGQQWAGDLSYIIDYMGGDLSEGFLRDVISVMDFSKIGVLGHSTGGGAAIQFCVQDSRCKALFGMDPYLDPVDQVSLAAGLAVPTMGIFSEAWATNRDDNSTHFGTLVSKSEQDVYWVWIKGCAHYDFTDLPAFSPLASTLGLKGPIKGSRILQIINDYTIAFFKLHLSGDSADLLDGPSQYYKEVRWVQNGNYFYSR